MQMSLPIILPSNTAEASTQYLLRVAWQHYQPKLLHASKTFPGVGWFDQDSLRFRWTEFHDVQAFTIVSS
jgi:hypothetical protein